jgi:hypothetical protein
MQVLSGSLATLVVASIYYAWRAYHARREQRRILHERVAFMLWVLAHESD